MDDRDEVRACEQRWVDAYLRGDADAFAALLADDFAYASERGVFDRAAYVDNLRTGEIEMRGFRNGELAVRVYGDTAVSTGVAALDARFRGQDISGPERFTRVWVRAPAGTAGAWLAVALHASRMEPEPGGRR